jgi:hypothetical protein
MGRVVRQFLRIPREFMRTQYAEVPECGTHELVRGSLHFPGIMLLCSIYISLSFGRSRASMTCLIFYFEILKKSKMIVNILKIKDLTCQVDVWMTK